MTLTLVDPSTAAVVHHDGGVISVRCADYVGPARGTLSTVSDSLAAAGTAVKEEQELAVATAAAGFDWSNATNRWGAADDTVVIPLGDLGRIAGISYLPMLSMRVEGEVPTTAAYHGSWIAENVSDGLNVGVAMGIGTAAYKPLDWVFRLTDNYRLTDFRNQSLADTETDGEDFVIRAWGVAGGSMAFYLDTVYFIPVGDSSVDTQFFHGQYFPSSHILDLTTNGTLWRDIDNDPSDLPDGFGKYSVLPANGPWVPGSDDWGHIVEFQQANNEESAGDVYSFGDFYDGEPLWGNPVKGQLIVPIGATYIPATTILYDDFSVEQHVDVTMGAHYVKAVGGYNRTLGLGGESNVAAFYDANAPLGTRRGTFVEPGDGFATTYFGPVSGTSSGGFQLPNGLTGHYGLIMYGLEDYETGFLSGSPTSEDTSDPRNYERRMWPHLEHFVISARVSMVDQVGVGGAFVGMRYDEWTGDDSGRTAGATLAIDGSGDLELSLDARWTTLNPDWVNFGSPVSVGSGLGTGDWWWIKVEKRGYWWRARAWEDGTTEPSTWDIEGGQPWFKVTTGAGTILYPWDDNWSGNSANDLVAHDPRGGGGGIADDKGAPYILVYWGSGQTRNKILTDDVTIEFDPNGTSPGDVHLNIEKYDGTADYGTVTIPYGAHRIVVSSEEEFLFNGDENGFNVRAWRDDSNPDLVPVGIGRMFLRVPALRGFIPFIYRRVVSG